MTAASSRRYTNTRHTGGPVISAWHGRSWRRWRTGDLQRAIRETEQIGRLAARSLAGDRHNVEAPDAVHAAATDAINRFVRYAISRMVPIGQILRQSLPA